MLRNEIVITADLGRSSNYSNKFAFYFFRMFFKSRLSFEGRSGEGFLSSGAHGRISRS